jgi:putative transposase
MNKKPLTMQFQKGYLYHIYNQGNNRQKIFFHPKNYLFFLNKTRTYLLPYADVLAWCLMPNHFHFMVLVKEIAADRMSSDRMTMSHPITNNKTSFNNSIAIMLRSYTRAINNQEKRSGSLFKAHTKAICLNCPKGITPSWFSDNGITRMNISNVERAYPQICFNYIHQNPVKSGIVKKAQDWEFSSIKDYLGIRNGKLINKRTALEYVNFNAYSYDEYHYCLSHY